MGWIGGLLLIAAGTGMGWYMAARLRRRVTFWETCGRLLQALWQEMSYTAQPMPDLWRKLAQSEAFSTFSLVRDTAQGLAHADFAAAFSAAVDTAQGEGLVSAEGREILLEFAHGCGRTDMDGQQAHVAYYRTLLTTQEEDARRAYTEKGRVYRMLGFTAGVALALLLM